MAPVLICSSLGVQPGRCSLIELKVALTEDYGVLVGCTLVDTLQWSASVLLANPSSEVVVLPSFFCMGELVPVLAVSVARSAVTVWLGVNRTLPAHLEYIVVGSHPSLGPEGRTMFRTILYHMLTFFLSPGSQ